MTRRPYTKPSAFTASQGIDITEAVERTHDRIFAVIEEEIGRQGIGFLFARECDQVVDDIADSIGRGVTSHVRRKTGAAVNVWRAGVETAFGTAPIARDAAAETGAAL